MTTTYDIRPLSGSTDFRGIKITTTASPGDTIHTAQVSATLPDLVTIDVVNRDSVPRPVIVQFGGTTSPDDYITAIVLPSVTQRICTQKPIRNSLVVKCFSPGGGIAWADGVTYLGTANVLVVHGHVQRQLT